ncbi:MAG: hypothetical protein Q9174_000200 [Haloplaca sp. 1 TL-2023]
MSLHIQRQLNSSCSKSGSILPSPKRKRGSSNALDIDSAPPPTRIRTTQSAVPSTPTIPDDDASGNRSPRAAVARHFQGLSLTGCAFEFGKVMQKPSCSTSVIPDSQASSLDSRQTSVQSLESQPVSPGMFGDSKPVLGPFSASTKTPLEIPETPRLKPTTLPSPVISPIQRSKSPPVLNLWWADAEITGHNPTDPADDGYGINGVGFIPTPAMASARAERRKRQVAEWKNREAREARQRRSEARRRRDVEMDNARVGSGEGSLGGGQERRVRFLEV